MTYSIDTEGRSIMDMVAEFHTAFGLKPSKELCIKLIEEEASEANKAVEDLLKEVCDVAYVWCGMIHHHGVASIQDEGVELVRQVGTILELARTIFSDETLQAAMERVHASNMSKLGDDGKPIRREDGKILKGPNYKAPDFSDLLTF